MTLLRRCSILSSIFNIISGKNVEWKKKLNLDSLENE